jgi:hypothetical protein
VALIQYKSLKASKSRQRTITHLQFISAQVQVPQSRKFTAKVADCLHEKCITYLSYNVRITVLEMEAPIYVCDVQLLTFQSGSKLPVRSNSLRPTEEHKKLRLRKGVHLYIIKNDLQGKAFWISPGEEMFA